MSADDDTHVNMMDEAVQPQMGDNGSDNGSDDGQSTGFLPMTLEIDSIPDLSHVPMREQMMLVLAGSGFSLRSIGNLFTCTPQNVHQQIKKYDPDRKLVITKDVQRAFLARMWNARASEALMHITPEKLQNAPAKELADIAFKATRASESLGHAGVQKRDDVQQFLDGLAEG